MEVTLSVIHIRIQRFLEKVGGRVIEGLARFIMQQLFIAVRISRRYQRTNVGNLGARSKSMNYLAFLDTPLGTDHK